MTNHIGRRTFLGAGLAAGAFALPGCSSLPGFGLTEAIRRLLTLSSQNAFAQLLRPGGFYDSQIARLDLPTALGGGGGANIVAAILTSGVFRDQLHRQLNRAAERGAELAAPLVADTIRTMSIEDAASLVAGGPTAATDLLRWRLGDRPVGAMLPGISEGLRLFDDGVISRALETATGIDFAGLADELTGSAADAIYRAIGAEEAAIRADPSRTNDPMLIAVFGGLSLPG